MKKTACATTVALTVGTTIAGPACRLFESETKA
jgi:hypothetical protein